MREWPCSANCRDHFVPARIGRERDDLAARHRDVVGVVLAEMEQVAQHLPFERREVALFRLLAAAVLLLGVLVDDFLELRAQRSVGVGCRKGGGWPSQSAFTVRVSVAGVGSESSGIALNVPCRMQ
jgi:hypothetical protein